MGLQMIKFNIDQMIEQAGHAGEGILELMAKMDTEKVEYDLLCEMDVNLDTIKKHLNTMREALDLVGG
jgi:hypothetical protein